MPPPSATTGNITLWTKQYLIIKMLISCRYIFPGLALGAALGQTGVVTDAMIQTAAEVEDDEVSTSLMF